MAPQRAVATGTPNSAAGRVAAVALAQAMVTAVESVATPDRLALAILGPWATLVGGDAPTASRHHGHADAWRAATASLNVAHEKQKATGVKGNLANDSVECGHGARR